jgi:hypothetical protein
MAMAQNWLSYADSPAHIAFQLPTQAMPATEDSSKLRMYASVVDSLLGIQIQIYDSAYFDSQDSLLTTALYQTQNDTPRAIAKLILLATNSELTAISNVTTNGKTGLEIGIRYLDLASDVPTLTFMRFFLVNHKFLSFTISGSEDDLPRLSTYKSSFFNSIAFIP